MAAIGSNLWAQAKCQLPTTETNLPWGSYKIY
jgi:hypothetical protein